MLWQRSCCSGAESCSLWIGTWDGHALVPQNLDTQAALTPMAIHAVGELTLTADGLTIIGVSSEGTEFLQATRAAAGSIAFSPASKQTLQH